MFPQTDACRQTWAADVPPKSQRQLSVSVCRHRISALAELGVAAAVAYDPAHLLAFDIAVDRSHPRVDFGEQQAPADCG